MDKSVYVENNLKSLAMQGLLNLDMHPLWKHFPKWQDAVNTQNSSVEDNSDPDSSGGSDAEREENDNTRVIRTEEEARRAVERGDLRFDHEVSSDALDGHPESIDRVVPTLRLLEIIRTTGINENENVAAEEFDAVMKYAMNSIRSIVQKDVNSRKRCRTTHRGDAR